MKDKALYKYTILFLLVLNLAFVVSIFFNKPRPPFKKRGKVAKQILHLDDDQDMEFLSMADAHKKNIKSLEIGQKELLVKYFKQLNQGQDSLMSNTILNQIKEIEARKIQAAYGHFQEIKSILRDDQMPYYEAFIEHAIDIVLGNNKKTPSSTEGY